MVIFKKRNFFYDEKRLKVKLTASTVNILTMISLILNFFLAVNVCVGNNGNKLIQKIYEFTV